MIALIAGILLPLAYLFGCALIYVLDSKESRREYFWEDRFLAGILVMIGLAEGAHLGALLHGRSVSAFTKYYLSALAIFAGLSAAVCAVAARKRSRQKKEGAPKKMRRPLEKKEGLALAAFLILATTQGIYVLAKTAVFLEYDVTLETVVGFLKTDALYTLNPLTGLPYAQGIPSRLKILCLPTLYASLCRFFSADPELVTWHVIPAITLTATYLAYWSLARTLFPEKRFHAFLFLALTALLLSVSDYGYGMDGFGLLHGGFQGTTIRGAVLMPYLLGLCLRKRWRLVLLPILAEACIVWTLYGMGMGMGMLACFLVIQGVRKTLQGRREEPKWENS